MNNEQLSEKMIEKSIEAFIMGLEVYNKPTIKYRIEGFAFFICNAWELMLKAHLLKRGESIYYKDNPERTISISDAINRVYTDKRGRINLNLSKIIDLRNISTHYITEDYEAKYAPLFQACVLNFISELLKFHNRDITDYIAQNFLTISTSYEPLSNEEIKLKYTPEIAEKFIKQSNDIDTSSQTYNSDKFAINIKQNLYLVKKKGEADFMVKIDKNAPTKTSVVKELKDPADTHKYSFDAVVVAIQEALKKQSIKLGYKKGFNSYVLGLIIRFYNIKDETRYSYKHIVGNTESFTYSQSFIEFIIREIKNNPDGFVESLKKAQ
jgi:hypothetical protein|nr:MAG TPA: Protein of unknown function (DUF3644) [Bacteriophage sp.]